jgi:hypothetical protein
MATQYVGNVLHDPSFVTGDTQSDVEILSSMRGYTQVGVHLAPGQGVILTGTVLGQVTATKLYKVYASGSGDGSQNPSGVLRKSVDTGTVTTVGPFQANMLIAGILKNSLVSGADANAITKLNARADTATNVFTF